MHRFSEPLKLHFIQVAYNIHQRVFYLPWLYTPCSTDFRTPNTAHLWRLMYVAVKGK